MPFVAGHACTLQGAAMAEQHCWCIQQLMCTAVLILFMFVCHVSCFAQGPADVLIATQ